MKYELSPLGQPVLECGGKRLLLTRVLARIGASSARSDIFIARPPSGAVKLRRSGMARLQAVRRRPAKAPHAAPTELEGGLYDWLAINMSP